MTLSVLLTVEAVFITFLLCAVQQFKKVAVPFHMFLTSSGLTLFVQP